jgi:hypothetical protein
VIVDAAKTTNENLAVVKVTVALLDDDAAHSLS